MSNENNQQELSEDQHHILRNKGTERPFSGALLNNKEDGLYQCAACEAPLFSSETKFESGSGWPSFYDVAATGAVKLIEDRSHGMVRTEAVCNVCDGHLGHMFEDGPSQETGKRYCINSAALNFKSKDGKIKRGDGKDD